MRSASSKASTRAAAKTAHLFTEIRQPSVPYLGIPAHVSESRQYFTAMRFDPEVVCGNANFTAEDPDGFLFAMISSSAFITWQRMIGGRIKSDLRFSNTVVWNNFPVPSLSKFERDSIIAAGVAVEVARQNHPGVSLSRLYDPGRMPSDVQAAHRSLDELVDAAFGLNHASPTEIERQTVLFDKYVKVSADRSEVVRGRD